MSNIIKARVQICGTRELLQHQFTEYAIPLPGAESERTGSAGNDPEEWKRTCMVANNGQLYVRSDYIRSMLVDAAVHTKKGRGSIQSDVGATLLVEEARVMIDRFMPPGSWPLEPAGKCSVGRDLEDPVFIHVSGVVNPATKSRNVRYRLACSPGWNIAFTLAWDKTVVNRTQMEAVVNDAGILIGLGNGRKVRKGSAGIGAGRFTVTAFEVIDGGSSATKKAAA